ncbi:MAG: chromosome segregation protein SMC [Eubacteriales bacterium]|nr:chromosome segregation protein SMC [Eubacteriales bacterium]
MYLKSIEIQGFKSFAHKTLLTFNNGVTGIVGPNGSGKSNISDAVRWVLGEQKVRQLRGSAMQDVIFAGTELRKAQGFAAVSITLDNSDRSLPVDYSEVTVTRKLFRSGESDYLLNGQSVRLKSIQELFYDTGIGREGYSIIGQGQIDAIINGKPQDRRGLFDEAAGIVKFKKRKLSALKRLESERESLVRVADILGELEKRLKPLLQQSEAARSYLKLRDEQKALDINLFVRQTDVILSELEKTAKDTEIIRASLSEAEEENIRLRQSGTECYEKIVSIEREIEQKRAELSWAALLKENLSGQINVSEAQIRSDEANMKRAELSLNTVSERLASGLRTLLKYSDALNEYESSLDALDLRGEDEFDSSEAAGLRSRIASLRAAISAVDPVSLLGTLNIVSEENITVSDGDSAADEQEDEDLFVLPEWMQSIGMRRDELSEVKQRESDNLKWLNKATDEYNSLSESIRRTEDELRGIQDRITSVSARLETIRNLAERYEGYGESVRSVMREKHRLKGIRGVVADIISTDRDYETAIETALGGRLQNIVTESEPDAKRCIEYLKSSRQGRATFLPLDSLKYRIQNEIDKAVREPGILGTAAELAHAGEEYTELKNYLLGSVLVANKIDNALAAARKFGHSLRIVTLEGELLSPGGAISGGAYRNNSRLMGRGREISEMEAGIVSLRRRAAEVRERINLQEKELLDKNSEIDRLNEALREVSEEKNRLSFSISADMRLKFSELSQKIVFTGENISTAAASVQADMESLKNTENEIKDCSKRIDDNKQNIFDRKADISHIEAEIKVSERVIGERLNEKEELNQQQSGFADRKEELSSEILELQKELVRLEAQSEREQQKLDSATEYIWNEYELGLSRAKELFDDNLGSLPEVRSRLNTVKNDIRRLGPVNVSAIEEYREVSERYGFMKSQYDDLSASEKSILGIIEELDTGMKEQFDRSFAAIKVQFRDTFRELFGGGEADLGLVYDNDEVSGDTGEELDAGISIYVQPPGKKLQSIMQLSGGEKALTAIALLFAIQNLKPSPFCLLDEIEAALDDSNVSRFADYLHKLTDHTQFIVITHRRGTMEAADRLYGVTMQEKGISKLISVDLIRDQLS